MITASSSAAILPNGRKAGQILALDLTLLLSRP
jgi:hypothetical protein